MKQNTDWFERSLKQEQERIDRESGGMVAYRNEDGTYSIYKPGKVIEGLLELVEADIDYIDYRRRYPDVPKIGCRRLT